MPLTSHRITALWAPALGAAVTLGGCLSDSSDNRALDAGTVANPLVSTADGGRGRASGGLRYDVSQFGYREREYFFEGTAKTFPPSNLPPAAYRSRMIVWTPIDPTHFNGTTVVEWAHVSVGDFELTFDIASQSPMLEEQGFAFVLVSAEQTGVCSKAAGNCAASTLRGVDPPRYGSLDHPGDDYSFDIFTQALQAIKFPSGTAPLGELDTRFIIVEGFQVQRDRLTPVGNPDLGSPPFGVAGPLNAYLANGAAEEALLADGFLVDGAAPFDAPQHYPAPTLHYLDESAIRREPTPNGPNHISWEVVGASHIDRWSGDHVTVPAPGALPPLLDREEEEARRRAFDDFGLPPDCAEPPCPVPEPTNTHFPRRHGFNAALAALHEWLETGVRPPEPPTIERVAVPPTSATMKLQRDSDGHAVGGLRSPLIEVPVAIYNGEALGFSGTSTPLAPADLAGRYPTHRSYVEQLLQAVDGAVEARTLLCADAGAIMRTASRSSIGGSDEFSARPACAAQ